MKKQPIFIVGSPRSGKTLIAEILKICQVPFGNTDKMLENVNLSEIIGHFLQTSGFDPKAILNRPKKEELSIPQTWKQTVEAALKLQEVDPEQQWGFKSHLIAPTWPLWHYAYPDAKFIIVRRRIGDIASSCMKTGYLNQFTIHDKWVEMVRSYEESFMEMISEGLNCKIIWPHRMTMGDYGQIFEMLDWLGLKWNSKILTKVDPKFWKVREK
jgi:hypothetical protein